MYVANYDFMHNILVQLIKYDAHLKQFELSHYDVEIL